MTAAELKQKLPLPELMALCGDGERAKKSARCPFHEDGSNSFSVWQRDGLWFWKCHAGCGEGDEIHYLQRKFDVGTAGAFAKWNALAGVNGQRRYRPATTATPPTPEQDLSETWRECVAAFTDQHAAKLATWRGYSQDFVTWLRQRELVGIHNGLLALPIHSTGGAVVAFHVRTKEGDKWFYEPRGATVRPLVIGDSKAADVVFAFESQWDAFAVLDKLHWHKSALPGVAVTVTRGASNGKLVRGLVKRGATLYAFRQNDREDPERKCLKWLADVTEAATADGATVKLVATPEPHKDPNEWTQKGGATGKDLNGAIEAATDVTPARPVAPVLEFLRPSELRDYRPPPGIVLAGDCHVTRGSVFVIPDNDKAGREGAGKTAAKLAEVATVHVVALPEMPDGKKDLRDWFALGNDKAALLALLDKARLPKVDVITEPTQPARYGLPKSFCYDLGGWVADYFALFEPRTEPSYAFHLAGALACMDTILGRRVFWQFGNTHLYAQDYYLCAGRVAAARKSTALSCAKRVIRCLESETKPYRFADGFSYESMPDEFAEWNLRLWVLDEFTGLMVLCQKEYGAGIQQALNSMWQGEDRIRLRFRGRDKSKAVVIENPTLTILGATSLELLQANLRASDHGGLTSRLLTFYAEGDSKDLPEPLVIEQHEVEALADRLRNLAESVSGPVRWTPAARKVWDEWYVIEKREAAANPTGFASRKPDHVRKIALKLAISRGDGLDVSDLALAHAIAIADKAEESWRKVFGHGPAAGGFIGAKAAEALDWIRAHACPEGIPMWKASRGLKLDKAVFDKVIQTLRLWEEIHVEERVTGGRPATLIWATKGTP